MKILEKQFNEQLIVEADASNNLVVIGNLLFSPVDILRGEIEEGLYETALQEWINEQWLPPIIERANKIIQKYDNRNRFRELLEAIKNETVTPFIGSGLSQPSGFPLWKDFLCELRARSTLTKKRLNEILNSGDYELAASEISRNMPPQLFNERLENTFKIIAIEDINGAVRYLPEIFRKDVITLNYDNILETLYNNSGNSFNNNVLLGERLADFRDINSKGERCLVKYHGDLAQPRTRVLTVEEYEKRYVQDTEIKDSLIEIFRNKKLLFLGCSLSEDRTMSVFKKISDADKNTPRHFALLKVPQREAVRLRREHFLTERSIFPIWYDGEHDESTEALFVKILKETGSLDR